MNRKTIHDHTGHILLLAARQKEYGLLAIEIGANKVSLATPWHKIGTKRLRRYFCVDSLRAKK